MPQHHTFSQAAINLPLSVEAKIHLYREMIRSRAFELQSLTSYTASRMGGFLCLQIGQESIAVAIRPMLRPRIHPH